jgi:hypothetical protein
MKSSFLRSVCAGVAIAAAMAMPVSGETSSETKQEPCAAPSALCTYLGRLTAQLITLQGEVQRLNREVLDLRVDRQRYTVARFDLELQQVVLSLRELEERDESLKREISEAEQRAHSADLPPEQRAEAEATRAELTTSRAQRLQAERRTLQGRESELRQNFEHETQRLQEAESALRLLTGGGPQPAR